MPIDVSLRNDIALAGSDPTNGTDDIYLVYSNDYGLTAGQLLVQNTTGLASKVIQFYRSRRAGRDDARHNRRQPEPRLQDPGLA